jgi:dihydrofolate synthase/folylpolyglutamate synthase
MNADLPVRKDTVREGLANTELPGRIQVLPGEIEQIIDVAHNPAGVANLAAFIDRRHPVRRNIAVFSMLKDKDLAEVVRLIGSRIASWHLAQLDGSRAATLQDLADVVSIHSNSEIKMWPNPLQAYEMAMQQACPGDRVVVFGSFYLVGAILKSVPGHLLQA